MNQSVNEQRVVFFERSFFKKNPQGKRIYGKNVIENKYMFKFVCFIIQYTQPSLYRDILKNIFGSYIKRDERQHQQQQQIKSIFIY